MIKNIYKKMMDQHEPSTTLINNTKSNMKALVASETDDHPAFRWRSALKPALIAAIIVVLSMTTVLAFGDGFTILRELFYGESRVTEYEFDDSFITYYDSRDGNSGSVISVPGGGIRNRNVPDTEEILDEDIEIIGGEVTIKPERAIEFSTFEDLRLAALFDIKEPTYIPEGWQLTRIYNFLNRDGSFSYDIMIDYKPSIHFSGMTFYQLYVGPDAYSDIRTIESYELGDRRVVVQNDTVMIGNIEAFIQIWLADSISNPGLLGVEWTTLTLTWIQDEILFSISFSMPGNDPDDVIQDLIKIGESMR